MFYCYMTVSVSSVQQNKMRCSGAMMVVLVVVGVCAALPNQDARAVANPRTPNQILDAIFERTVTKFR